MADNNAIGSTLEGGNSFEHRCFKTIGRTVFRHRWPVLIFGHCVLIGLCFGLLDVTVVTDVSELWIETGSRLRDERDITSERFGAGTAINLVTFQALDNSQTAVTEELVKEMIDTLSPILVENTLPADKNLTADVLYDSRVAFPYKWSGQTAASTTRTYSVGQVCERPPVPKVFQPTRQWAVSAVTGCGGTAAQAYVAGGTFSSWAYTNIHTCLQTALGTQFVDLSAIFDASIRNATNGAHTGADVSNFMQTSTASFASSRFALTFAGLSTAYGVNGLTAINTPSVMWPPDMNALNKPTSWGVQRFPCTRLSVADCFKEGNFDYPRDLAVVDGFGFVAWQLQTNAKSSGFSTMTPLLQGTLLAAAQASANGYALINGISNWGAANITASPAWVPLYTEPLAVAVGAQYATCVASTQATIQSDMGTLRAVANTAPYNASAACAGFRGITNNDIGSAMGAATGAFAFLGGIGYSWRNTMTAVQGRGLTLSKYVVDSIKSSRAGVAADVCLGATLGGSNTSCCPVWATSLVPDNFWLGAGSTETNIPIVRWVINLYGEGTPQFEKDILFYLNSPFGADAITAFPGRDEQEDFLIAFQKKWLDYLDPFWARTSTTACAGGNPTVYGSDCTTKKNELNYLLDISVDDIIAEASNPEGWLVIMGYVILVVYTSAAVFRLPCVYSRVSIGLAAIYYVALSVVASFGLTAIFMDLNPLSNNLAPFLGLGLGMDDAYVMIQTTTLMTKYSNDPEKRMEEVMVVAGPSVMLTSITVAISFFVASLTPIPAVTAFVVQMGFSVSLNLFGWMTVFAAIVSMDSQRVADKRRDVLCCITDEDVEEESTAVDLTGGPINTTMTKAIVPCLKSTVGKVVVLVLFLGMWVFLGIMGFTEVSEGFLISDIALKGSYQRDYTLLQEQYFGTYSNSLVTLAKTTTFEATPPSCLATGCDVATTKGVACDNTCKQAVQLDMMLQLAGLESVSRVATDVPGTRINNWLASGATSLLGFKATVAPSVFGVTNTSLTGVATGATTTEATMWLSSSYPLPPYLFGTLFGTWTSGLGAVSLNDLVCAPISNPTSFQSCEGYNAATTFLEAAKTSIYTKPLLTDTDFTDVITEGRDLIDSIDPANSFMAGYVYNYWDQYVGIQAKLIIIVGWALLGTFLSTLILQFSPFTSLLVVSTIIKVVMECYGFIWVLDIKLNAFSLVNLTVSVGLAVEFTAHISHVFLMAKGTRNERMEFALMEMMAPMFNGMLSSFLAVVALALAKFPFFRAYYFGMFSFMIVVAFLDGMIFLPVVLSLIGPAEFTTAMSPPGGSIGMNKLESRADGDEDTAQV